MSANPAVAVANINFRYSGQSGNCLSNIDLNISAGDRFGLFGPNGAGKTTLISIMTGLLKPQHGNVFLFGMDISTDRNAKKMFERQLPD